MTKSELAAFIKLTIKEAILENKNEASALFQKIEGDYCIISKVAEKFKVTKATIHNWAKRGTIKKYRINGRTLYRLSEIENAVN